MYVQVFKNIRAVSQQPFAPLFHIQGLRFVSHAVILGIMGEIERRAGAEPAPLWQYAPSAALLSTGMVLWDIQALSGIILLILGISALVIPFRHSPRDIDSWKIPPFTSADRNHAIMHTVVPTVALAGNIFLGDSALGLPPVVSSIGFGVAFGVSTVFAATRIGALQRRKSREHIQAILAEASLAEVSTSDLEALDQPGPRMMCRALLAHGAVDGTRVMSRQVAKVLDWSVEQVHTVTRPLNRRGITSCSTIMSGGDPGKVYVELTKKGMALLGELHHGR